ncbi:hypothetical protein BC829DRAFT_81722 [Chytridium lagenaria]|nr:hypothetical protein BC829DRAFT_81722 [Chytridium lagenaria]
MQFTTATATTASQQPSASSSSYSYSSDQYHHSFDTTATTTATTTTHHTTHHHTTHQMMEQQDQLQQQQQQQQQNRSQRHNLKLASDHRTRFSNPYDDCLDRLVDLLWSYIHSLHPTSTTFSESSLPPALIRRARGVAPKGSKWTVWISTELKDKFAHAKDTFAKKWTHAEFVEMLLCIRDSVGGGRDAMARPGKVENVGKMLIPSVQNSVLSKSYSGGSAAALVEMVGLQQQQLLPARWEWEEEFGGDAGAYGGWLRLV